MHMEIQVALTFVISYLYNKLPRRRVNIFGEELEKALKHKFQGHWYPEKPFKGSAFRCLKTGEPMDAVLEIAARESGVPIGDILENLPAELSVWVDPGEVSYRIGEKGAVKILYSEQKHDSQEDNSADREVTSTFNPEAQCFRPIEIVGASLNGLTLSPKGSPNDSSSTSSTSPMYKNNSPSGIAPTLPNGTTFLGRTQEPIQFTTATFAQTKFGSTKLKNNSKRTNSRMSPTEFSNYIKQRQMQQHNHYHGHQQHPNAANNGLYGAIGSISPARSISPNPMTLQMPPNDQSMQASPHQQQQQQQQQQQNSFVFQNGFGLNMYQSFGSPRNVLDANGLGGNNSYQYNGNSGNDALLFMTGNGKCSSSFLDQQAVAAATAVGSQSAGFCKIPGQQATQQSNQNQQQQQSNQNSASVTNSNNNNNNNSSSNNTSSTTVSSTNGNSSASANGAGNQQQSPDSKLLDGMNSFYNNSNSSYQHLLVAN